LVRKTSKRSASFYRLAYDTTQIKGNALPHNFLGMTLM
jgi:hypothetical protein